MITEDYVSFETAKLLKEKGFDIAVRYYYQKIDDDITYHIEDFRNWNVYDMWYSMPTYQMAMKWLREKHIIIVVQPEYFNGGAECSYWGVDIWADDNYEKLQGDFPSYEEAVEAALKYSLENLI